ncbi:MAG TPA: hypothetical protein VK572_00145 [Burkholderiales bacterium]|nr:hypothetical protein [Burkholderiales bacterium]
MKLTFPRDIPRRAALVVVALALIAGVVAGREEPSADTQAGRTGESASVPATNANGPASQATLPDLDLDKLARTNKNTKIANLFAPKVATLAPPPVNVEIAPSPPPPPPAPTTPPLPFRYFGKLVDGDRTVVFLWKNSDGYSVAAGDTVDGSYRIESITDSSVNFIYLPIGSVCLLPSGR